MTLICLAYNLIKKYGVVPSEQKWTTFGFPVTHFNIAKSHFETIKTFCPKPPMFNKTLKKSIRI